MNKLFTFVHILDEVIHVSEIEGKTKVYLIYGHTWADSHLQAFHWLDSFQCLLGGRKEAPLTATDTVCSLAANSFAQENQGSNTGSSTERNALCFCLVSPKLHPPRHQLTA